MKDEKKTVRWIKENIEAIAIAIVMALVIRQFAVEAFMIPTESMAPTLLGKTLGGTGDRILVDKVGPRLGSLPRYSVIVFKYPLNTAKNYIKRLIGLGGETLSLRDGDVVINGKVARKPAHVQEVLFFPVYPGEGPDALSERKLRRRWAIDELRWNWEQDALVAAAGEGESLSGYVPSVKDAATWDRDYVGYDRVGDVRLGLTVTPAGEGEILLRIVENQVMNELRLAVGSGKSRLIHGDTEMPLEDLVLASGAETDILFANVDDALVVSVDGRDFTLEYESAGIIDHEDDAIRFGVNGTGARFTDLRLWRDVYYVTKGNATDVKIPEGHLFALGDNSRNSKDSRLWTLRVVEMKDGTLYEVDDDDPDFDSRYRQGPVPGTVTFQDRLGIHRLLREEDIADDFMDQKSASFIPRENLIGRAFFVFWPLNALRPGMFRLKFIR